MTVSHDIKIDTSRRFVPRYRFHDSVAGFIHVINSDRGPIIENNNLGGSKERSITEENR